MRPHSSSDDDIRFFHPRGIDLQEATLPDEPAGIAIISSVRDVGTQDRNGSWIETASGPVYMEGATERLIREMQEGGRLHGWLRFAGLIIDDQEHDMHGSDYPMRPKSPDQSWIFPQDLRDDQERLVLDETEWIPSTFRRRRGERKDPERAHRRKEEFERRVAETMQQRRATILLSDHYIAVIEHLHHEMVGRVLNIHPAPTVEGEHCFRGLTPTADAIARAQQGIPTRTGATLHFVDDQIDVGQAIAFSTATEIDADDKPQLLRVRNYQTAKLPVVIEGLRHYAAHLLPLLRSIEADRPLTPEDVRGYSLLAHVSAATA